MRASGLERTHRHAVEVAQLLWYNPENVVNVEVNFASEIWEMSEFKLFV